MDAVIKEGSYPDGRSLCSTYTGISLLDDRLTFFTAFYEPLSNSLSAGPRLLFFDLNFVLSCTNVWVFIGSRRRGVRNLALRHPISFVILWNAMGAALLQPFYFYFLTQSKTTTRDPTIPLNEAIALFIITLPTVLFPLFLFAPTWLNYSTWQHQGYIAIFQAASFLMAIICLGRIALMLPRHGLVSKKKAQNPNVDRPWIVASLIMAAIIAATVLAFTVIGSLRSTNPVTSLACLFIPSPSKVDYIPRRHTNATLASTTLPPKYQVLLEAYLLFTQIDWIVVVVSSVVFTHYLLSNSVRGTTKSSLQQNHAVETRELACHALGSVVLGPGAAGSFALAARARRLREQDESHKYQ